MQDPSNFLAAERELSLKAADGEPSLQAAEREPSLLGSPGEKTVNTKLGRMAKCIGETITGALSARAGARAVLACLKRTNLLKMQEVGGYQIDSLMPFTNV